MRSRTSSIQTAGASLRIRVAETEGTPLLFIHGGPGGTDYLFKFFAVRAAKHGYRPVGMILRGCPGSPSDGPFTVDASIDDFEHVRRELKTDRIALLGHSHGGFLAAAYAALHPDRIERLMLVCPSGARSGWRGEFDVEIRRRLHRDHQLEYDRLTADAERAESEEQRGEALSRRTHLTLPSYYSPHHAEGQPGLASLTWKVHEQLRNDTELWTSNPTWEEGLSSLTCPCSLLYGEDDPLPMTIYGEYAEMLPNIHIQGLPRSGHFPWIEEPEAFREAFGRAMQWDGTSAD